MNEEKGKNIVSFSGGKDSTATVILAHIHKIHIDEVIFSEVMFDDEISGELPEHIEFIKNRAFPLFEKWGFKTKILHSDKNYMDCFYHVMEKSGKPERIGKYKGFVLPGHCDVQRDCKLKPLQQYLKEARRIKGYCEFVGIAADETKRLKRLKEDYQRSLLSEFGYTEKMAYELAKEYGLLSPIYEFAPRGGCWFCPNAGKEELKRLRNAHQDLWIRLLKLEDETNLVGDIWNTRSRTSIKEIEKQFQYNDAQLTIFDFLESEGIKP